MTLDYFSQLLQGNNGIKISEKYVVWNDYELYNLETDESRQYKSLDDLVKNNKDVAKIIEESDAFYLDWSGGRGSGSGGKANMGGGFGSARTDKNNAHYLYPAELNIDVKKGNNVENVTERFKNKYGNANREYAIAVDENGYAKQHIKGGKHSVGISGDKGDTISHNHPSGSNFSKADLMNFATTKIKGIKAVSSNKTTKGDYSIEKTNHFKPKEFAKAVNNAKWDTNKFGYNDGADWWLKSNQKKYGYKYSSKGMENAGKEAGW